MSATTNNPDVRKKDIEAAQNAIGATTSPTELQSQITVLKTMFYISAAFIAFISVVGVKGYIDWQYQKDIRAIVEKVVEEKIAPLRTDINELKSAVNELRKTLQPSKPENEEESR